MSAPNPEGRLTEEALAGMRERWEADPRNEIVVNALGATDFKKAALSRRTAREHDHQFTHRVKTEPKAANQKASGRCWLFAFINTVRAPVMEELKLEDFTLSANWLAFHDKFEKCNWLLECVIKTADEPDDSRVLAHLLTAPVNDGGQFSMIIDLVEKYGVVPASAFPETAASGGTRVLNTLVTMRLREFAMVLRRMHAAKAAPAELRATKAAQLDEIYRILVAHLGQPPASFDWTYRNKDKETTKVANLTAKQFYEEYVRKHVDVSQQISVINDPRNEYYRTYTVDLLGNVVGGRPVVYVNVPADVLAQLTRRALCGPEGKAGETGRAVWFGCDVGKFFDRPSGVMDLDLFRYDLLFGTKFEMSKADRLVYKASEMTHAMVFTGVDIKDDTVERYRVENTWGTTGGDSGYMSMSAAWFKEYVYQILVPRDELPADVAKALDTEPVHLPPWDPMGALA